MALDITEILERAVPLAARLNEAKAVLQPDFPWYPYDSYGTLSALEEMLHGPRRRLLDLAGSDPVLDLGCGDGQMAFLWESLGCGVHAYDYSPTNHNGMRGVRLLRQHLGSGILLTEMDLDSGLRLGGQRYGLACALGLLYHLKNPFLMLEEVSRAARYLLLSTRIARMTPDQALDFGAAPMAYLAAEDDIARDETVYWMFSESGLRRLLERSGWKLLDFHTVGTQDSDPITDDRDQRAYCLARSLRAEPVTTADLLDGWHDLEKGGWRWTEESFSAVFRDRVDAGRQKLVLRFRLPDGWVERLGAVEVRASVNGTALPPATYTDAGEHAYTAVLPPVTVDDEVVVEFTLDKFLPPEGAERRKLGLVVSRLALE